MVRAIELERALSKDEILALYLSLAPYGGNLEGVRAASLAYFGKEPRRLTLGEAALLVALPQSPERAAPTAPSTCRAARATACSTRRRCRRLRRRGRARQARAVPTAASRCRCWRRMPPTPRSRPRPTRTHRLTIRRDLADADLEELRASAPARSARTSRSRSCGRSRSRRVLARVASADYFDERRAGQVDMTQARALAGSTLKPFIYGLGFEDGSSIPNR
jgi:penicillin-binding protein 1C